jgi:hypothetical protein
MNCKPGDLAVIADSDFPENIGHIVEVLRPCPAHQLIDPMVPEWECKMISELKVDLWSFGDGDEVDPNPGEIDIQDRDLRPISGVPINDEVRDEITA